MKQLNPTRARACAALTAMSLLAVAACGGQEDAEPPATSAAVANTAPSTILPPATTTPAPTTPAPTTEPAPPSTAPTSPTTTPLSEEDQAKQAVIAAAEHAWYVFNEAKLDPTNADKVAAALSVQTGNARTRAQEVIDQEVALNQRSRTLETAPAWVEVAGDTVRIDLTSGTASLELCHLNSNTLIDSATDAVVDDRVVAYHTAESYVLIGGAWLKSDGTVLDEFEGALACDPHS